MSSPKAVLLVNKLEDENLHLIAEDIEKLRSRYVIETLDCSTRQEFFQACSSGGKYDSLQVVLRSHGMQSYIGQFDRELIFALPPSVKAIASLGAGYELVDIDAARERGIQVSNTPQGPVRSTATAAMWLLLSASRRFPVGMDMACKGEWKNNFALANDVETKTLGIIGMGAIGRALARRALGFDMKIAYYNRRELDEDTLTKSGLAGQVEYHSSIESLLKVSDCVSLHAPLNMDTANMINADTLSLMKDGVILVNTARGGIIDEEALLRALESGKVRGCGLDVFQNEPHINPALISNKRVVLLPHIGTSTIESQRLMQQEALNNAAAYLDSGIVLNLVAELRS